MKPTVAAACVLVLVSACEALKSGKHVLTPRDMLALPRPAAAIAGLDGQYALSLVGIHSFENKTNTKSLYLISTDPKCAEKDEPALLVESNKATSISEPLWLNNITVGYLNNTAGSSQLWYIDLTTTAAFAGFAKGGHKHDPLPTPQHLHTFPTEPSSLKFSVLPETVNKRTSESAHLTGVLGFSAHVWKGASIEDTEQINKAWAERDDEGLVWDETYIREWDTWRNPDKVHQVFLTLLDVPTSGSNANHHRSIRPQATYLAPFNASSTYSLMQPFEPGQYDVSVPEPKSRSDAPRINVIINVKDKYLNYAFHTRRQIYMTSVGLDWKTISVMGSYPYEGYQFSSVKALDDEPLLLTSGDQASVSESKFSPDGSRVVWLEMQEDGNESDRNTVVVHDLKDRKKEVWTETWDRSPSYVAWALDSKSLYVLAEDRGSALPYHLKRPNRLPTPLVFRGSTSSIQPLSNSTFLLATSTLTHPNEEFVLDISEPLPLKSNATAESQMPRVRDVKQITSWSHAGLRGKDLSEGEPFWFEGANEERVMGWIVRPPGFKESDQAKWPLAMLIHGGPQGAWEDSWSTRWNPNVFAQQGYFVIAINPHGSTGYGQEFCDSIHSPKNDWGGKPYRDLVAGLQSILDNYPAIDKERLVAAGGSYGGYMINWLQGHNQHTNFKAMVNHDGVFDVKTMYYSTEQVYFSEREGGGMTPWEDRAQYEDYNPINFVGDWNTPMLVIHGGQDFRIPDSQGIAAFTALQRRGIPSRLLYFPKENHWVLKPQNSLQWHTEVFRWFDEFVGVKSHEERLVIQA